MLNSSVFRATSALCALAFVLSGCTQISGDQGPQPTTAATSTSYTDFGPRQPSSGFQTTGNVIAESTSGIFGTTDAISVDDSGPFPAGGALDPSLSDFSAEDQSLLAGIDLNAEAALASSLTFPGDDGSTAFFDADIGPVVYFATNSSVLSDDARATLRSQAAWLNVHPDVTATVEGHTDERGTREFNIALGERRASAVRSYLTALGVAGDRVRKVSYGKERPAVLGSDPAAWELNRRAETKLSRATQTSALSISDPTTLAPTQSETSIESLLNDPALNDVPSSDPLFDDPLLNDPLLNDPLLNDI